VNESAQRVTADDSKQPQDQEDYKYCPEHFANTSRFPLSLSLRIVLSLRAVLFLHFDNTGWTPSLVRKVVRFVMSFQRNLSIHLRTTTHDGCASRGAYLLIQGDIQPRTRGSHPMITE
jgi:hypothetical protein